VNKKKLSDTDTLYREIRKRSYVGVKKKKKGTVNYYSLDDD
jgi:hypothetical protein